MYSLQTRLNELGFDAGKPDGIAGPKTAGAFDQFLRDERISCFDVTVKDGKLIATAPIEPVQGKIQSDHKIPWMAQAYDHIGLHETSNNKALKRFLRSDNATIGDPAVFPWCGDFVQTCLKLGLPDEPFTGRVQKNPYLAKNWRDFGEPCVGMEGAVGIFYRGDPKGPYGHVAFYVGEDDLYYYILGGNQANKVSITKIAKSRCLGWRFPVTGRQYRSGPVRISDPDIVLSTNEA